MGALYLEGVAESFEVGLSGQVESVRVKQGDSMKCLSAGKVVCAAGAWAAALVDTCGEVAPLPVRPRKRCIFSFHCPEPDAPPSDTTPLTVLTDGVYFRPEGRPGHFLTGVSPPASRDPDATLESLVRPLHYARPATGSSSGLGILSDAAP